MSAPHCAHCRQVARQAARCVYLYAAQVHLSSLDDRLLAEARAEYRRIQGACTGGHVTAAKRRHARGVL